MVNKHECLNAPPSASPHTLTIRPIGHIHTDFPEKFGIPRQSGLVPSLQAYITFEGDCRNPDCIRDIERFDYLWLIWGFSENQDRGWSPTVRPPRLGGNVHTGVFASRSPFRPNPLGLSSVRLEGVSPEGFDGSDGPVLHVSGADLMDGTPIYDIKPYAPLFDSHPEASGSFTHDAIRHRLRVHCEDTLLSVLPAEKQDALLATLSLDPRPGYHDDPDRIYGMDFGEWSVKFRVDGTDLYVERIGETTAKGCTNCPDTAEVPSNIPKK